MPHLHSYMYSCCTLFLTTLVKCSFPVFSCMSIMEVQRVRGLNHFCCDHLLSFSGHTVSLKYVQEFIQLIKQVILYFIHYISTWQVKSGIFNIFDTCTFSCFCFGLSAVATAEC